MRAKRIIAAILVLCSLVTPAFAAEGGEWIKSVTIYATGPTVTFKSPLSGDSSFKILLMTYDKDGRMLFVQEGTMYMNPSTGKYTSARFPKINRSTVSGEAYSYAITLLDSGFAPYATAFRNWDGYGYESSNGPELPPMPC